MPKVLRIINRLNLGGPTYNAAYLSSKLAPEFETLLVAGMRDESEESSEFILEGMNLKPHYIHTMRREINFKDDQRAYSDIKSLIREFKPDIVHTHAAKAGTLGRIAAYQENVPVIVHTFHGHVFHSYFNKAKTNVFINIERIMARFSTGIIAISEEQKKELSETYRICSADKIATIPLGFDLSRFSKDQQTLRDKFRRRYNISEDTLTIGIVGRLVPIKNHPLFIKAWKEVLKNQQLNVHAFIIGDGESRKELESLCEELEIVYNTPEKTREHATLTFTSWIHEIELALAGLDIVALSSNNEGTPVSLIEAQAAGKPIISTDVGGLKDTVIPGKTAIIVPPDHLPAFSEGLNRLIADRNLRTSMSLKGPGYAAEHFSLERLVSDMSQYYHHLLEHRFEKGRHHLFVPRRLSEAAANEEIAPPLSPVIWPEQQHKPRVLQIVNRLNLGGITYNVASIASRLRPEFETMIVAGMKEETEESSEFMLKELGLTPVYIPDMMREINLAKDHKAYKNLLQIIRDFNPDIVHTHAAKAGMVGRLAAKHAGVPVIVHTFHGHVFHHYFGKVKTAMILQMERYLSSISSGIIAISESQKAELCQEYKVAPKEKVHIVELGYDLLPFQSNMAQKRREFRSKYHIDDDTIAIGIIGRIVPIKNLGIFIRGFHEVNKSVQVKTKGLIIGDGADRAKMEFYCRELGIRYSSPEHPDPEAPLVFTSWIFDADIAMAGLDIVALTSLNEGTPASLIEAQAAGKPIISTDVGGVSNIVIPDVTALLVPSNDLDAYTKTLRKLVNEPHLRQHLSQEGPEFANRRFNYTRLNEDVRKLYYALLKNARQKA